MKRTLMIGLVALSIIGYSNGWAADPAPAADDKAFQEYMGKMQAHMKLMQEQMQKMQQTKDSAAQEKLRQEHWVAMQEGMRMMHGSDGMAGCGMMMGGMQGGSGCCGGGMHGMSWWNDKDASSQAITRRQRMMGSCMGMQQQMMDQMMQHQGSWMRGR